MENKELKHVIAENKEYLEVNKMLFEIYNDNLTTYLKKAILNETKTESARQEIFARLNTTNILKKIVDKLAVCYNNKVVRKYFNTNELKRFNAQEIIENLEEIYDIDYVMALADILLNINGTVLFRIEEDKISLLPAYQFLNINNALIILEDNITVIKDNMKYTYDKDYKLISATELAFNPYIIANKSLFLSKPFTDYDTCHMVLLLPLMLTDLNYALRFQSHSIIYGINIDATELAMTPNSYWSFKSNDDNKPELGTINPTVDADKLLNSVRDQFLLWLDTKNIKVNSVDGISLSGVAKAIDNASVDDQVKKNQKLWKRIEDLIWGKIYNLHSIDENYLPAIIFLENKKTYETNKERIENYILLMKNGLKTKKQILQELNPDLLDEEIEILYNELQINSEQPQISTEIRTDTNTSNTKNEVENGGV